MSLCVPSLQSRTRAREKVPTVLSHVTPSSADHPPEQSHYLELLISALVWRPTVRLSSRIPCARLLLAWRSWSSPFGKASPSLGTVVLDHAPERHEENVWCVGRDVSPYVCDVLFLCQSTRPSHQSRSRDPRSARELRLKNHYNDRRETTHQRIYLRCFSKGL